MAFSLQTKEKVVAAIATTLIFIALTLYSTVTTAQETPGQQLTAYHRINRVSNMDMNIELATNLRSGQSATEMESVINSPYAELKPALTPDGNRLYFSRSYHPQNTSGELDAEDIWYSDFDRANKTWSDAIRIPGLLNNHGPNFINSISASGDTLILGNTYGRNGKMNSGLSYSVNMEGQWSVPRSIVIEYDYNMSPHANAYVSLSDGVIILAVERIESIGQRDLYVSFWDGHRGTVPLNMGSMINTDLEESSPTLSADRKSMYFASRGHAGFGGLDIFVTRRLDDSWTNWSPPQNLGPAVNSPLDEEFFTISRCGKKVMFSRQVSVHNADIYEISSIDLFYQLQPAITTDVLKVVYADK